LKKIRERWAADYKPKPPAPSKTLSAIFPPDSPATSSNPYKSRTTLYNSDDDADDEDELDRYLRLKVVLDSACPNPIRWWLDHAAVFPNLMQMALDYIIIPATSVDAERAFSACTLALGKLRTRLSDDTFRAGLLLRSWHKAGLLPELGALTQCLKDSDIAERKRHGRLHGADSELEGESPGKKVKRI